MLAGHLASRPVIQTARRCPLLGRDLSENEHCLSCNGWGVTGRPSRYLAGQAGALSNSRTLPDKLTARNERLNPPEEVNQDGYENRRLPLGVAFC
jgi:hypothetical protein